MPHGDASADLHMAVAVQTSMMSHSKQAARAIFDRAVVRALQDSCLAVCFSKICKDSSCQPDWPGHAVSLNCLPKEAEGS